VLEWLLLTVKDCLRVDNSAVSIDTKVKLVFYCWCLQRY